MRFVLSDLHGMSGFLLRCFILVLALLAGACGPASPKLPRLASDAVVLAFGDSLTYGTGASEQESYPAQLEQLIGRRVVRAGIPGEVSSQALQRPPAALDEHAPRLLLLCIGGNDFLQQLGNPQAESNVRAMVRLPSDRRAPRRRTQEERRDLRRGPARRRGRLAKRSRSAGRSRSHTVRSARQR
jgi:hypothetical protein